MLWSNLLLKFKPFKPKTGLNYEKYLKILTQTSQNFPSYLVVYFLKYRLATGTNLQGNFRNIQKLPFTVETLTAISKAMPPSH